MKKTVNREKRGHGVWVGKRSKHRTDGVETYGLFGKDRKKDRNFRFAQTL
jgi:hypothetical protein